MKLEFVTIEHSPNGQILQEPSQHLSFPLSEDIQKLIQAMKKKLLDTEYAAGIAAPQVGFPYKLFVFHVDEEALSFREDASEIIPVTAMINASYTPIIEEGMVTDWEGCFSVAETQGKVARFKTIEYEGYTEDGQKVEGRVSGFLARLFQHEIDHTNGILILDRLTPDCVQGSIKEMQALREQEMQKHKEMTEQMNEKKK